MEDTGPNIGAPIDTVASTAAGRATDLGSRNTSGALDPTITDDPYELGDSA